MRASELTAGEAASSGESFVLSDVVALRTGIRARELFAYEFLEPTAMPELPRLKTAVDQALRSRWHRDGTILDTIVPPIPWEAGDRSDRFHKHAWDPLGPLLILASHLGEDHYFDLAWAYAEDWLIQPAHRVAGQSYLKLLHEMEERRAAGEESFVWYDMAVGQRAYRLAYLIDVLARRDSVSDRQLAYLVEVLYFHLDLLAEPAFFRSHNNHGLYQALGHLAATRRFSWWAGFPARMALASAQTEGMVRSQFFDDGVHREHSPGYHLMVLQTLVTARGSGVIPRDDALAGLISRAEQAMAWMITPNGKLANFGDTDPRNVRTLLGLTPWEDPRLLFALTDGRQGEAVSEGVMEYAKSGYAFARHTNSTQNFDGSSYLAMQAGFHSRVHKHADHLTFVWHDSGLPIIEDPARYAYLGRVRRDDPMFAEGFWYSDPKRVYVESTRAHNCVEIDGKSYNRRRLKPFGSALKSASEVNGITVFDAEVVHEHRIRHRRTLLLAPGQFLVVLDWLHDRSEAVHDFRQWFHLAPVWHAEARGAGVSASCGPVVLSVMDLLGTSTCGPVVRGQTEPVFQGWVSERANTLSPAASLHFEQLASSSVRFATLFALSDDVVRLPGSRTNVSLSRARLNWRQGRQQIQLHFDRGGEHGTLDVKLLVTDAVATS